jgi:hypothetical protein
MDMAAIAKGYVDLQKRSANNLFDAVALFQDFADNRSQYWADQMGFDGKMKTVVDEWRVVFKKGCEDSLNLVNDGFNAWKPIWTNGAIKKRIPRPRTALNRFWVGAFGHRVNASTAQHRQTITRSVCIREHSARQSLPCLFPGNGSDVTPPNPRAAAPDRLWLAPFIEILAIIGCARQRFYPAGWDLRVASTSDGGSERCCDLTRALPTICCR